MKERELEDILQNAVGTYDMDWIVFHLVKGAVRCRKEADEGANRAEQKFWQGMVSALVDFQTKLENMGEER